MRLTSLFLQVAPKPLRELFRNSWDARYPDDPWHAGDGSTAEREACAKLLMEGSDVCVVQLPGSFTRGKGNVLEPVGPPGGLVSPKDYLKPGDRVRMVRSDGAGNVLESVDARVAKSKKVSLDTSVTVEAAGLVAPAGKPESGWCLFAPRVHTACFDFNKTQETKLVDEGISELDVSGLHACLVSAYGHDLLAGNGLESLRDLVKEVKDLRNSKLHDTKGKVTQGVYNQCRKAVVDVVEECVAHGFLDSQWRAHVAQWLCELDGRTVYQADYVLQLEKVELLRVSDLQARKDAELRCVAECQARAAAEMCAADAEAELADARHAHVQTEADLAKARRAHEKTLDKIDRDPHLQLRRWLEHLPRMESHAVHTRWLGATDASSTGAPTEPRRAASAAVLTLSSLSSAVTGEQAASLGNAEPFLELLIHPELVQVVLLPSTVLTVCRSVALGRLSLDDTLKPTCERWYIPLNDATLDPVKHCVLRFVPADRAWVLENGETKHGTRLGREHGKCTEKLGGNTSRAVEVGMWFELGKLEAHERKSRPGLAPASRSHFLQVVGLSAGAPLLPPVIFGRFEHEAGWGERRGGFGSIAKYFDTHHGRFVAVKAPKRGRAPACRGRV